MASLFGHGLIGYLFSKTIDKKHVRLLLWLAIISAIFPDIDVISFKLGVPYESWLGHRGFTHSIIFAILWALLCAQLFGKKRKKTFFIVILLATLSHSILDAMTNGGMGVGFLIPFDNSRYFFPFRPIQVSPIGVAKFFSEWGLKVILSELIWIGIPAFIVLGLHKIIKKRNKDKIVLEKL